ncbi:hypothetical protein D3OALGA1CA_576 [Olavius algarvensis associated proteobacterium Delta 3]|nr:hypothetical protein D3OALGA1CA_576 [Olavius algarvensis associated proteobacterium Delta 3]CAB5139265.1 hypothetical protein D3OALGB2SA_4136 [Olavius algarvensis associated proteobacterium Delta 3]
MLSVRFSDRKVRRFRLAGEESCRKNLMKFSARPGYFNIRRYS